MFKLMVGGFYFECECVGVGWDVCERERGDFFKDYYMYLSDFF